ncbi:hypothetical protein [Streptomyces sp. RPT161]|uniref:hypothetical protein n=1 Tax=Streptomyces sp. RPT161 TaxID=3015993 RepID=UPI0022B86CCC|nr:hypothetical protein [Streptomyces sp. RPT161]
MGAVLPSVIAVLGTLLGSTVTHAFQRRTAERAARLTRDEKLRQERIDAYCGYAGALLEYRRVLVQRWFVVNRPSRTVAERAPGESALAALRRRYLADCEAHAALLGRVGPGFARLAVESPALRARLREIYDQQEQALARVLFHEARRRSEAGQDEEEFFAGLADAAREAFGLLEPALRDYAVR